MPKIMTPRGMVEVAQGAKFVDTIMQVARDKGLKTIRVFIGEIEVLDPKNAPAVIEADVTLYPFDIPAS